MKSLVPHRLLLLAVLAIVVFCAWLPHLEGSAGEHADKGLKRSLATFAVARTLGAALSAAQGTELSIQPFGMGVTTTPGQVLRPVNELVDKFADMMLFASVAFGIQILLLKVGGHHAVGAALSVAMLLWVASRWRGTDGTAMRWLQPVLVILLMARFVVPLTAFVSEGAYQVFMKPSYDTAYEAVRGSTQAIPGDAPEMTEPKSGLDRYREQIKKMTEALDKFRSLGDKAEKWADQIVNLIAIFVIQTVLIPLVFVWLCWHLARSITTSRCWLPTDR
jgi:hypothetical protein